jgi:hypothetical protein
MPARVIFRVHALRRMFERNIGVDEIVEAIEAGETIESYPEDTPCPSRLILAWVGGQPLHVVVADSQAGGEVIVITTYRPEPGAWNADFRKRSGL